MENSNKKLINDIIDSYILSRVHTVAPSTLCSDRSKAKNLKKVFKGRFVEDIKHSDIRDQINRWHKKYSNKTINEFLTIIRAVFELAERDGLLQRNPMDGIESLTVSRKEPNPFRKSEIQRLFETPAECMSGKNAALLNILTGLRISELLALGWDDVDWLRKVLHVRHAKVLNCYKTTKTEGSEREVELNDLAISLLKEQKALTDKKRARTVSVLQEDNKSWVKKKIRFVFYNSKTNQPFLHAKQFGKTFFTPFLEKAEVEHRGPGQLRHTYASQCLTAGISKEWLAQQMGHNSTEMIDKHYGRWMKSDAPDYSNVSVAHLADAFGQSSIVVDRLPSHVSQDSIALANALQNQPKLKALVEGVIGGQS
ncbi:tyrosine-type recombinase/integrase [Vibrio sp. SCSIO 43137]|uniref:tyrosine-type recombinase/integrase n=1 Tax=Vibrio sp. SCSIO 43137 TaxID=3021011 RepID=UPI0023078D5C|nr:tyrosine-type recombinase/integrase [Vibrio sp. SCSIO 43137]WCE28800.1 tyrosine-type recombinase/integrase [Vibrio sp. SCSIO 43137]